MRLERIFLPSRWKVEYKKLANSCTEQGEPNARLDLVPTIFLYVYASATCMGELSTRGTVLTRGEEPS